MDKSGWFTGLALSCCLIGCLQATYQVGPVDYTGRTIMHALLTYLLKWGIAAKRDRDISLKVKGD